MGVLTVGGIDPSSKKIALVETKKGSKKPFIHVCTLKHERVENNQLEAFNFIFEWGMEVIERDDQPPRLFLEEPVMGGGGPAGKFRPGATIPQAFVSGTIMAAAAQLGAQIDLVNNSTWKKRVLGNGNIAKENITEIMQKEWPELVAAAPIINAKQHNGKIPNGSPDQDVIDAGGLNLFGWRQVNLVERIKKRRQ